VPRIEIAELTRLIDGGHDPVIIDARSLTAQQLEAAIPGALAFQSCVPDRLTATIVKDRHVVIYRSCLDNATAAWNALRQYAQVVRLLRPQQACGVHVAEQAGLCT
jgi:hypothetical protein